ncbi:MAG TPA: 16S rRNA (adenine(1518)-N(6)/adenine(1519)-N(6))-dimethyltransferase RsmA [Acidimicrobiales bacterium]|nr:16S rRNA (adenine(1518)-N(6)/adenine(1519)-N(6))-dimethyltransferase RsmA [Acidimicrobiales bacterium]
MALTRGELKDLLAEHGLRPSRALGQNFVVDSNTLRRVARLAELEPGDPVVEVGAGLGALTLELARTGAWVTAVEIDRRLVPILRAQVSSQTTQHPVRVVEADALSVDWRALLRQASPDAPPAGGKPWALVANLPYNVAVPVLARVLDEAQMVRTMLVMVQREVAERLVAAPGGPEYGAVSVKVAYHATARIVGAVPASVFVPRPGVSSSLVRIIRRAGVAVDPSVVAPERLFEVVRAGFAHRRKMLRGALAGVVVPEAFAAAGVDPRARAQELSVEQWGRLAAVGPATGPS